jgi:hypothetical protein
VYSDYYTSVTLAANTIQFNSAFHGGGIWWRAFSITVNPARLFSCQDCVVSQNTVFDIATQAFNASGANWPSVVQSGVAASDHAQQLIVTVSDVYTQADVSDDNTVCTITSDAAATLGGDIMTAQQGIVDFSGFSIKGAVNSKHRCVVTCQIDDGVVPAPGTRIVAQFDTTIGPCNAGWALGGDGACARCNQQQYSPHGNACVGCPEGATCVAQLPSAKAGVMVGSIEPASLPGYWLAGADTSVLSFVCPDFQSRRGACLPGTYATSSGTCATDSSIFTMDEVYQCTESYSFYECPVPAACAGGAVKSNVSRYGIDQQCAKGYWGVYCNLCSSGFAKNAAGACTICGISGVLDTATKAYYMSLGLLGALLVLLALFIATYGIDEFVTLLVESLAGMFAFCGLYIGTRAARRAAAASAGGIATVSSEAAAAQMRALERKQMAKRVISSINQFGAEKAKASSGSCLLDDHFASQIGSAHPSQQRDYWF